VGSLFILALTAILGLFHFQGDLDAAYEKATIEGLPILQDLAEDKLVLTPWIQGVSSFITVFCFPLLPLLCSSALAQELVLWKLAMDFLGPALLLIVPRACTMSVLATLGVTRAGLLVVTLLLFSYFTAPCSKDEQNSKRWLLVGAWDLMMLLGAIIACLSDTSDTCRSHGGDTPVTPRRQRLRKIRLAHHIALCIGLITSGTLMYIMEGPVAPKRETHFISWTSNQGCSRCASPDPDHGTLQSFPCGGNSDEDVAGVWLFHYGANMGCKKLSAIEVQPQTAQAVYVPGRCLRFGSAEGTPTSSTEPAFGNLVSCEDGCVHGVLHRIPTNQLSKLDVTEPGYQLAELPEVVGYNGKRFHGVKAYVMQHDMTVRAPSRRYGGLLYCTAKEELAPSYAKQLSCELEEQGVQDLACASERFVPLAAQN